MGKRTVLILIERLVELSESAGEVALLLQRLAPKDRRAQLYIGRILEHVMIGIDTNAAGPAESFNRKGRVRSHHFNSFIFRLAISIDAQVDRHPEEIQILRNFSRNAEAFIAAQPV